MRLRAQLAPFILRRTKSAVATELPPKVEMDLLCPLTPVQRAEYARLCGEGLQRLGNDVGAAMREKSFGFLALLTRLRQVCCDPDMLPWIDSPLSDSGKLNLLVEKLAEVIESGHKVVIFSQFVMLLDRVKAALAQSFPHLPRYELTGMTLDRQKPVLDFQTAAGAAVMLVSLKAARRASRYTRRTMFSCSTRGGTRRWRCRRWTACTESAKRIQFLCIVW